MLNVVKYLIADLHSAHVVTIDHSLSLLMTIWA
jgi:hypothetical protein